MCKANTLARNGVIFHHSRPEHHKTSDRHARLKLQMLILLSPGPHKAGSKLGRKKGSLKKITVVGLAAQNQSDALASGNAEGGAITSRSGKSYNSKPVKKVAQSQDPTQQAAIPVSAVFNLMIPSNKDAAKLRATPIERSAKVSGPDRSVIR